MRTTSVCLTPPSRPDKWISGGDLMMMMILALAIGEKIYTIMEDTEKLNKYYNDIEKFHIYYNKQRYNLKKLRRVYKGAWEEVLHSTLRIFLPDRHIWNRWRADGGKGKEGCRNTKCCIFII